MRQGECLPQHRAGEAAVETITVMTIILLAFCWLFFEWWCDLNYLISLSSLRTIGSDEDPFISPSGDYAAVSAGEGSTSADVWLYCKVFNGRYKTMPYDIASMVWLWFSRNNNDKVLCGGDRPDHAYVYCKGWVKDDHHLLVRFNGHDSCSGYEVPETYVIVDISTGTVTKPDSSLPKVSDNTGIEIYVVYKGSDTWKDIAEMYAVTEDELRNANKGITNLKDGMEIIIPPLSKHKLHKAVQKNASNDKTVENVSSPHII